MSLDNLNHLNLDKDTKEILKVFLNDDNLLKYLLYAPTSSTDDVQTRPSVVQVKTLSQRFNEYYLGTGFQPLFISWGKVPEEDSTAQGRICFYPGIINLKDQIDRSNYMFDILCPFDWHVKTNVAYKVTRRVVELLKNTHTFGDIGRVNFDQARPFFNIPNYVGYQITASNYNFVG
jgi:hypothetical protein